MTAHDHDHRSDFARRGRYKHTCARCGAFFYGHAGRVVCKLCDDEEGNDA